eukprot:2881371-Rhodomonas_salina.2
MNASAVGAGSYQSVAARTYKRSLRVCTVGPLVTVMSSARAFVAFCASDSVSEVSEIALASVAAVRVGAGCFRGTRV